VLSKKLGSNLEGQDADAAVVLLVRLEGDALKTLLVKRVENTIDPWSGDMALPGGKRAPQDRSILQTVVRETSEETGIDLLNPHCHLLGTLGVFRSTRRPELKVLPFIGMLDKEPSIALGDELESYIWIGVNELTKSHGVAEIEGRCVPAFIVGKNVIWGLTFRILERFTRRLGSCTAQEIMFDRGQA